MIYNSYLHLSTMMHKMENANSKKAKKTMEASVSNNVDHSFWMINKDYLKNLSNNVKFISICNITTISTVTI